MGEISDLMIVPFEGMSPSRTFRDLVQLNTQYNLPTCLANINAGHYLNPDGGDFLLQGEENHARGLVGAMVAVDGLNLVNLLQNGQTITDLVAPQFFPTPDYGSFAQFLIERKGKDGGYAHIDVAGRRETAKIQQFSNDGELLRSVRHELPKLVPPDFFVYGRTNPLDLGELQDLGTKTLTAALIARAYSHIPQGTGHVNVDVCQIKLTAYGYNLKGDTLGIPRVTRWGEHGFAEDAYFAVIPQLAQNQYIVPDQSIALIHRQYQPGSEGVRLLNTRIVTGIEPVRPVATFLDHVAPPLQYTPQRQPAQFSHYSPSSQPAA